MTLPGRGWADRLAAASDPGPTHLATEAVVAYVDGELSVTAHERATRHLAACAMCTAEVAAQRQARAAVRSATTPSMPPALLAALHAIPQSAELPPSPDGLAIDADGQFVVPNTPPLGFAAAPIGSSDRIGSSPPLGRGHSSSGWGSWRARASAGVVVSGLVVGAIAFAAGGQPGSPGLPRPGANTGPAPVTAVPARFDMGDRKPDGSDTTTSAVATSAVPAGR